MHGLRNTSDETLSRRKTSGVNAGYTIKNASRRCYASPDLGPILIFRVSGHDLQIGSKSRNWSRMDLGGKLEDREPPFPQKYRDRREQEPKEYTRASYPQMRGVCWGCVIIYSGAKSTPGFVGDPRGNQGRDANNVLESTLGRFINQTRLQLDPLITLLPDHRSVKHSGLEKIDQRYSYHRRTCRSDCENFLG